jgi:E3 ubiquitin-protein ligase HERC2
MLSSGEEVELIENGKNINLSLENKKLYVELVEKTRLNEGKIQIDAIRSGLEQVIPIGILKLISWNEIEMLVCGKPILDVELLKENTVYRGFNENDTVIAYFWKCIEEFSTEERASYLRFVWGRSRLPLTSKDFPMKHRIEIMHHNNPDIALPTSHTCFFSLEIPKYSSYEILHDKLKYAITHCQAIDTDGNAREIWDDEE